jgi:predicted RecB family nuclease
MRQQITELSFYRYLKCPSWIAHDARAGHLEDHVKDRLQQDGLLPHVEKEFLRSRNVVEITGDDPEECFARTLEEMKKGTGTIYAGTLIHDRYVARPDILERVEGKSKLGTYYYVACDIKRSRRLKEEFCLQGCFYADVLGLIQGTKPTQGYVMHPNGEIESYLIADSEVKYRLTLDSIERILEGEEEPHFLTSDCKQSPWFETCKKDALECDSVSRLNRVWRSEARELEAAGFKTVSSIAGIHGDLLAAKVPGISPDRMKFLHLQAKALKEQRHIAVGRVDLPESDISLIVDIEGDPLRDLYYLFGVLEVRPEGTRYHSFLAKKPEDEKKAWEEFIAYIRGFIGVPIYHYGWSEQEMFRVLGERYGTEKEVLQMLEEQGVDLLVRLREAVIFPLSFYSLKDIAQYLGFRWRHDDASGLNSVLWFEEWLLHGKEEMMQDILDYNEDDVRATLVLKEWAEKHLM